MTKIFTHTLGNFLLKRRARVPRLQINRSGRREVFDLVGDLYLIGRNEKECDIVITTPLISQIHAEIRRDSHKKSARFFICDRDSTNGIYRQKGIKRQRVQSVPLQHNMIITLGPPELKESVTIRFLDPPPWYVRLVGLVSKLVVLAILLIGIAIGVEWQKFTVRPLPVAEQGPLQILAGDQTSINPPESLPHTELPNLQDFGSHLPAAIVVSEDSSFYWNVGIDPVGIARAIVTNLRTRQLREGASTITQQLARNIFRTYVGGGDTPGRKWREAIVALKLNFHYSKAEILTLYLNRVYLGYGVYGFRDAALLYFGKEPALLDLAEAATLAGILPAPERINPFRNKKVAIEYRDRVLQRLAELKKISWQDADRARRSVMKLNLKSKQELESKVAPYFYSYIYDELYNLLGEDFAREGHLIVETSLNPKYQDAAIATLQQTIDREGAANKFSQGAILTIDTNTGAVLAMVGGANFSKSQFNRASQARRQPGSTFKLFSYAAALQEGISPSMAFSCAPLGELAGCRGGSGAIDMYQGFALSENVVAVRIGEAAGLPKVRALAQKMGITSSLEANTNLVLGGYEVSMLEIAGAYAAVANQGKYIPVHGVQTIRDSRDCPTASQVASCRVVYAAKEDLLPRPVLDPEITTVLETMMRGTVTFGTGRAAMIPQTEAIGKTGTTDNNRDLWFIGIAPAQHTLTAVWLGNDEGVTNGGSSLAAQLWGDFMRQIL